MNDYPEFSSATKPKVADPSAVDTHTPASEDAAADYNELFSRRD